MHTLLEWIRERAGDAPPSGEVDQKDVVEVLPDEIVDGYSSIEGCDGE